MTSTLKSANVGVLDAVNPFQALTSAEGASSRVEVVEDSITFVAGDLVAGSTVRLARIPANAKVKRVEVQSDQALDTNAASTLVLDFSLGFSDSTNDGTPTGYQGFAPKNTLDGTLVAITDANRNKVFGSVTQGNNTAIPKTDITFAGLSALSKLFLDLVQVPLAKFFGFVNGQGYDIHCPGFMDVVVNVATGAATAHAGTLFVRVEYSN